MNYAQNSVASGTVVPGNPTVPYTLISRSITTSGYPVLVTYTASFSYASIPAAGFRNNTFQVYRGTTAVGQIFEFDGFAADGQTPISITVVDTPSAGTYTYSVAQQSSTASTATYGPMNIAVVELQGATGATGPTGPSNAGLIPIVPSSVAVGSGSGSAASDGLVTFTGASSVSLNGVFSSTYRNYEIMFNLTTMNTASSAVGLRLRASGTDNSTSGSYLMALVGTSTGGATTNIATTGTQATFSYAPSGYQYVGATITLQNPFIAAPTKMLAITTGTDVGYTTLSSRSGLMAHNQSTSYDGITFLVTSNMTGFVKVYGYN
jgi:hypothetical protein